MTLKEKLLKIQTELEVKKNQYSSYGGYYYRSIDDIYEGLKPFLKKYSCILIISDELETFSDKIYIRAVATLSDVESDDSITVNAFAQESEHGKMTDDQQTGTAASYARKYALNALFLLSDSDAKAQNKNGSGNIQKSSKNTMDISKCKTCGAEITIPEGWTKEKLAAFYIKENKGKVECDKCLKKKKK